MESGSSIFDSRRLSTEIRREQRGHRCTNPGIRVKIDNTLPAPVENPVKVEPEIRGARPPRLERPTSCL